MKGGRGLFLPPSCSPQPQQWGTSSAKRLLPPWHFFSGSRRGTMPVLRFNSVSAAALELAIPEFWGLPFCLLPQSTDRMRGFVIPSQPCASHYLLHLGLSTVGVQAPPAAPWDDGQGSCGHLESSVCTGISVSGINRKCSLADRFLPPPPFFNKPCYILKGFYKKCGHLFSQPQGTFFLCDI